MARKEKYTIDEVAKSLSRKGCNVDTSMKVVNIKNANDLGNGSWGKIDYLVNHCKFTLLKS